MSTEMIAGIPASRFVKPKAGRPKQGVEVKARLSEAALVELRRRAENGPSVAEQVRIAVEAYLADQSRAPKE